MKKIPSIVTAAVIALSMFLPQYAISQSPEKMSYQSVIRNAAGDLVSESPVGIQISILQGSSGGTAVYMETHTPMTNINGLVSLELGMGTPVISTFSDIDWGNGPYFIQTETDTNGGTSYTLIGVSELLSVPFALFASESGNTTFTTSDSVTSNAQGDYATDDFVFGSPQLESDGNFDHAVRLFFDKSRGAFRVGAAIGDSWDDENVGSGSIAMGAAPTASGTASVAIGESPTASGTTSLAMGRQTTALGAYSTAMGNRTTARSVSETAIGVNNTSYSPQGGTTGWSALDRLFVIGNGTSNSTRSDAMVVLKNGNVGLGTSTPNELLEIAGDCRAFFGNGGGASRTGLLIDGDWQSHATRIESYDYGTGQGLDLVFNEVGNGNVGIKVIDPNVSLDVSGSIEYTGTITDVSDERLKENFAVIEHPIESILQIQGYSYNMKDDKEMVREYGVIAQEIQLVFPELVTVVDEENGYLGVSYVQLIPILLEAIKEQQEVIENLQTENSEFKEDNEDKDARLDDLDARLQANTNLLQELNGILKTQTKR